MNLFRSVTIRVVSIYASKFFARHEQRGSFCVVCLGKDGEQDPAAHERQDPAEVKRDLSEADRRQDLPKHANGRVRDRVHDLNDHEQHTARPKAGFQDANPVDDKARPEQVNEDPNSQLGQPTDEQQNLHGG